MLEPGRLAEIAEVCRRNGVWFVSDEIYHGLTYGMSEQTALAHSSEAVVINSFSKYFSMTGWRVGWLVVPQALVRPIERLAQNLYISPPTVAQVAAIGAFDGIEELEANKRVYAENRALLLDALPKAGLARILPADGAFYLYVDVSDFTADSLAFSKRDAGRHRRRRHAGDRLRRRARRRLRALLLCRHHRRHGRGRAAARGMEPARASEVTGDLRRGAAPDLLAGAGEGRALVEQGLDLALLGDRADLHGVAELGFGRVLHGSLGHEGGEALERPRAPAAHLHALLSSCRSTLDAQKKSPGCDHERHARKSIHPRPLFCLAAAVWT